MHGGRWTRVSEVGGLVGRDDHRIEIIALQAIFGSFVFFQVETRSHRLKAHRRQKVSGRMSEEDSRVSVSAIERSGGLKAATFYLSFPAKIRTSDPFR